MFSKVPVRRLETSIEFAIFYHKSSGCYKQDKL